MCTLPLLQRCSHRATPCSPSHPPLPPAAAAAAAAARSEVNLSSHHSPRSWSLIEREPRDESRCANNFRGKSATEDKFRDTDAAAAAAANYNDADASCARGSISFRRFRTSIPDDWPDSARDSAACVIDATRRSYFARNASRANVCRNISPSFSKGTG